MENPAAAGPMMQRRRLCSWSGALRVRFGKEMD